MNAAQYSVSTSWIGLAPMRSRGFQSGSRSWGRALYAKRIWTSKGVPRTSQT